MFHFECSKFGPFLVLYPSVITFLVLMLLGTPQMLHSAVFLLDTAAAIRLRSHQVCFNYSFQCIYQLL